MILLVDDMRTFADGRECVIARSSAAAIRWLSEREFDGIDELWLDHDLGGFDTGMKVVEWLESERPNIGRIIVHSSNPAGAKRMIAALEVAGYDVRQHWDSFTSETFTWIPPGEPEFDKGVYT